MKRIRDNFKRHRYSEISHDNQSRHNNDMSELCSESMCVLFITTFICPRAKKNYVHEYKVGIYIYGIQPI